MRRAIIAAALVFGFASSSAHAALPPPSQDPFYDVPSQLGKLPNGKILKSREIEASAAGTPLEATAWQLEFKSLDAHDKPTAMVTTVLVPDVPWTGPGERPIVSYQVAEDSADPKCAVSYALSGGTDAMQTESNAATETPNLNGPLSRGWAVVAPDYQGPHSAFLSAPEEAHGVLDSLKAALAFKPAGFDRRKTPIGIWGYSGGGYATGVAALFQPTYAPKLNIVGAAMGAPAVSVRAEIDAFSGSVAGGAIAMGIAALKRAYPEAHLGQYLNDAGRAAVAASAHDCLAEAAQRYPFASIDEWSARPGILDDPKLDAFLRSISPLYMPGHPEVPIFHYHDQTDEFAPIGPALETMRRWCRRGSTVDVHVDPAGEHIAYLAVGAPLAMSYLADRFAGVPAPSTCAAPPLSG